MSIDPYFHVVWGVSVPISDIDPDKYKRINLLRGPWVHVIDDGECGEGSVIFYTERVPPWTIGAHATDDLVIQPVDERDQDMANRDFAVALPCILGDDWQDKYQAQLIAGVRWW